MKLQLSTLMWCLLVGAVASGQKLTRLTDINQSVHDGGNTHFVSYTPFANKLFFVAGGEWVPVQQWVTDGTLAGTVPFTSMHLSSYITGRGFTLAGSKMFFLATDSVNGTELWVADSASGSIHIIKDIRPGVPSSAKIDDQLIELNGRVLFAANNGIYGKELWISDGTASGTGMVKDICSADSSVPYAFLRLDSQVVFKADSCFRLFDLFSTDGTFSGTHLVKQGFKDSYSAPSNLCRFKNGVICSAGLYTQGIGYNLEPWLSDGTNAGTHILKDINPNGSSNPRDFVSYSAKAFFRASDLGGNQYYMYTTDGTDTGTHKISFPVLSEPTFMNGRWYGAANDSIHGTELWTSDGTANGTWMVKDIYPGINTSSSGPRAFVVFKNRLYFSATDGTYGRVLWSTDGTDTGTHEVIPSTWANANALGYLGYVTDKIVPFNNALYYAARYDSTGTELWRLDLDSPSNLSIGGHTVQANVAVYPNPANDIINVTTSQSINTLMVYDAIGRPVLTAKGGTADVKSLPNGAYMVIAITAKGMPIHGRFLKLAR